MFTRITGTLVSRGTAPLSRLTSSGARGMFRTDGSMVSTTLLKGQFRDSSTVVLPTTGNKNKVNRQQVMQESNTAKNSLMLIPEIGHVSCRALSTIPEGQDQHQVTILKHDPMLLKVGERIGQVAIEAAGDEASVSQSRVVEPSDAEMLGASLSCGRQILDALDNEGFAIVTGPGYSGKSEYLKMVVPDRESFDLKSEYLHSKFGDNVSDKDWDNYEQHKEGESQ